MKAILVDENKNLVWSDVPNPVIKDDEVLVKIHAAALNRADLLQRQGKYPSPAGCPEWMGLEIAGVIVELSKAVTDWKIGDRSRPLGGGGYAEYER
ncbi:MAG: alcohol dehydrogenase catalytic domain-containing protein [Anaeromassilibacillus sp.]